MATQTQVLIAHTGQRLQVDVSQFSSLDDFKSWVARQCAISPANIVALTPQGKTVKLQTIQTEKEIYIYDIRIIQASSPGAATSLKSEAPLPKRHTVSDAPNTLEDTRSLQAWQDLFKSRRQWALKLVEDCGHMAYEAQDRFGEMDVMIRCLDAAVANLDSAVRPIEPKYSELKKWITETQDEYSSLTAKWEQYLSLAQRMTISPAMVRFMTGKDIKKPREATLDHLIELEVARRSGKLASASLRKLSSKASDLDKAAEQMFKECDELFQDFDKVMARSVQQHGQDVAQLMEDIEAVARKVDTDYQTVLGLTNSSRDVPQASKTAANHTQRLLPTLQSRAAEMDEMLQSATQARNDLAADSIGFMRRIADITSLHHSVKTQMTAIHQTEDYMSTFDYLRLVQQLPYMYASFVAEAVRRRDWSDKIKLDSSTLANEMAIFQDEELKRRRKWQKMVGSTYGPEKDDNNVLGLEVNLLGEEEAWPAMSKQDLDEFVSVLQRQKAEPFVIEDVSKLIAELTNPTKQQSKRVKAFKNGSIHEANLGRSGLMIRGDDDLFRALQDEKTRLESKLKTAESRVRRLEDLLHRQTAASRASLGNIFQNSSHQASERRDSTSSLRSPSVIDGRRRSSAASEANEAYIQRIQQLESELASEKERSSVLEKESITRTNAMKDRIEEVNSTKKDLLENMEALKREFVIERNSFEDEIKKLQARLEETEDEIENCGESRENEKVSYDQQVRTLENRLEQVTNERHDENIKTNGQLDFLRTEARMQRERIETLQNQLQDATDSARNLTKRVQSSEESGDTQIRTLRQVHESLSPEDDIPDDLNDLMEAVTTKSADVLAKIQSMERDMSLLKSDVEVAQTSVKDLKSELFETQSRLENEEIAAMHLKESLKEEKARCSALEGEVTDGRSQISQLRAEMTEGESGSESLRQKLEEEETKTRDLSEQLASRQSQVGSLEEELRMWQEKLQSSESKLTSVNKRIEARTERTKDLTQRLYTQNERLCRLLERLGFSVARQAGSMTIQKIPRAERGSQNPNDSSDPGSSIRRSVSLTSNLLADSADLKLLYWMKAEDSESEADQYQAYMSGPGYLDIDAFSDSVYRRIKEIEHTARKMTRDARGYRERAHSLAKDAHEKIAFKHFKEGDLALFLPTRNQTTGAWAAFNVGCPHFFLREQEGHRLRSREWLVARITRIQERVVDLSKSMASNQAAASETDQDSVNTYESENDNPFDLSDGLRWWLIDAHEDKPGAPTTPGLGKSTVAATNVDAMASIQPGKATKNALGFRASTNGIEGVSKTLHKSLDSRRSSTGSKKAIPFAIGGDKSRGSALASETNSLKAAPAGSPAGTSPLQSQAIAGPSGQQQSQSAGSDDKDSTKDKNGPKVEPAEQVEGLMPPPPRPSDYQRRSSQSESRSQSQTQTPKKPELQRERSSASVDSPSKKSVVWDSLWSMDVSYPGK